MDSVWAVLFQSYYSNTWAYPLFMLGFEVSASIWPMASVLYSLFYMVTHQERTVELELMGGRQSEKQGLEMEEDLVELLEERAMGQEIVVRQGRQYMLSAKVLQSSDSESSNKDP